MGRVTTFTGFKTFAAVYRAAAIWLEGEHAVLATLATGAMEHLGTSTLIASAKSGFKITATSITSVLVEICHSLYCIAHFVKKIQGKRKTLASARGFVDYVIGIRFYVVKITW